MSNGRLPECETCQYFKNLLREINRSALQTEFKLAKLASINTDLLKALESVEWAGEYNGWACCPWCGGLEEGQMARDYFVGHKPDCQLNQALKKARGNK